MPTFQDLGLERPLSGQQRGSSDIQGPKVPNFKKLLPQMRKEGLFGPGSDQLERRSWEPVNGVVRHEAMDMEPTRFTFDQLRKASIKAARGHHVYSRASGLSANLQNQQSMKSASVTNSASFYHSNQSLEGVFRHTSTDANCSLEEVCCVCGEGYSWEDQKVFTKCCDTAIGSHCRAQQIADTGACWNCGVDEVQSEALSEPGSWVSYDPKDFATKAPALPRYVTRFPAKNARRQLAIRKAQAGGILPNVPTIEDSDDLSGSNTRGSEPSQVKFMGLSEEQWSRELGMYRSRTGEQSSGDAKVAPHSSPQLMEACMKNDGPANGGFHKAKTTPPESQNYSFQGSESAGSDLSWNDQQHIHGFIPEVQKQQEARQYVIEATKHLVEMCDAYGDEIDEADKDDVMDEILKAVGGCKMFQVAIEKRSPSTLTTQPTSVSSPAAIETSNFKPGEGNTYCRRCEELESRLKKAADALTAL